MAFQEIEVRLLRTLKSFYISFVLSIKSSRCIQTVMTIDFKTYSSLINEGSQRTRGILYVMLLTSILMFVPYWNVRPDNWLNSRISIRQNVVKWYGWDSRVRCSLINKTDIESFDESKKAAELFGIDFRNSLKDSALSVNRLQNEIIELRKINIAKSFISIPIFNVIVDINDLSLFGGFASIVILSMLRASIWRELSNITFIFDDAEKQGELLGFYRLLSMSQVLTVPPIAKLNNSNWRLLNALYIFLPLFVQSYTFIYDLTGIEYALIQNKSATIVHMLFNSFAILMIGILTVECLLLAIRYNEKWQSIAAKLNIGS